MVIAEFIVGTSLMMKATGAVVEKSKAERNKARADMAELQRRSEENRRALNVQNQLCMKDMDKLNWKEFRILSSLKQFADLFEKIKSRPEFDEIHKADIVLPRYDGEEIKNTAVKVNTLMDRLGGAGGMAATGAATAAAITLGTVVFSGPMAGAGILVGGLYYAISGRKLSSKVEEVRQQVEEEERKIKEICDYLFELQSTANRYGYKLDEVNRMYQEHLQKLDRLVNIQRRTSWKLLTAEERSMVENIVLLVQLLYSMCKLELIQQNDDPEGMNEIRSGEVIKTIQGAKQVIQEMNMNY